MPRQKRNVFAALSPSHLRAIGLVAAQWADLETSLLWIVGKAFKIEFKNAVILAGAQNATAWCEMLRKLTNPPQIPGKPKQKTELDALTTTVTELLKARNDIVHTAWHSAAHTDAPLRAAMLARGAAIPKRGNNIFTSISYTTKDMLNVAEQIATVEQELFAWWAERKQTNRLVELLRTPASPATPAKGSGMIGLLDPRLGESAARLPPAPNQLAQKK